MIKTIGLIITLCSFNVFADTVDRVYACGNDVGIQMKDAGFVVALESQLGEKRVDRILSVALTLVTTQKQTGYFNPGTPIRWCGIDDVNPITVLGISK